MSAIPTEPPRSELIDTLIDAPERYVDTSYNMIFSITDEQRERLWIQGARRRFAEMRPKIAMLETLAVRQGVDAIATLDDLAPLLFKASTYNSYPLSWLEKGDFGRLTRWLDKLTVVDLSHVNMAGVELIEEWFAALAKQTDLIVCYSTTTSGKMTFLPRTVAEWQLYWLGGQWRLESFGEERAHYRPLVPGVDKVPIFFPGPKGGNRPFNINLAIYEDVYGEGLVKAPSAYMDADLMSLAGRIQEASKRGEEGMLAINPRLLARKDEIAQIKIDGPAQYAAWVDTLINAHRGQRVWVLGTMGSVHALARQLLAEGTTGAFTQDSLISVGSGFPDGVEPENWQEEVYSAFGIPARNMNIDFGMGEMMSVATRCPHRHYHLPPTTIPYILDVDTDEVRPRSGSQTGRFAFFDLLASTYWGGFVSGDQVTLNWNPCACGRTGAYLSNEIGKIPEDGEKIGCAGSAQAHDDATEFLLENS